MPNEFEERMREAVERGETTPWEAYEYVRDVALDQADLQRKAAKENAAVSEPTFLLRIDGRYPLAARYFWDDSTMNDHADATEADAAEQVRLYIEAHGIPDFLSHWNLGDLEISVGSVKVTTRDSRLDRT